MKKQFNNGTEELLDELKKWGNNPGEFEELIQLLANSRGFQSLGAQYIDGVIFYSYTLTDEGNETARNWAKKYGHSPMASRGEFHDENRESAKSTVKEWINEEVQDGNWRVYQECILSGVRVAILTNDEEMVAMEAIWDDTEKRWETDFSYPCIGIDPLEVAGALDFQTCRYAGYAFAI